MKSTADPKIHVPFLDLRLDYEELRDPLDEAYRRVMESGAYILGGEVEAFESEWARACGVSEAVGVSSGLSALELILRAYGIGPGDEVLVPSHTSIATWLAVSSAGAVPVPVEPGENSYRIDPGQIKTRITARTRAVLPVHLYGDPADMNAIREIADIYGLKVIEDAAQAHGARHQGSPVGSLADAAAFSFYPTKNLGAFGDAGAVTTQDPDLAEKIRKLRNYGSKKQDVHEIPGINSRMSPLQAAFLRVKLERLESWNTRRTRVAAHYQEAFAGLPGLILPPLCHDRTPVWHLFVVRHPERDVLRKFLAREGIQTLIHYPVPPHLQGAYASAGFQRGDFPRAERLAREVLSLPCGPHQTREQTEQVIGAVRRFAER